MQSGRPAMKSIDWASAIMFGAKRTNGWREERGAERSRLERMLERNDESLIADLFWRHPMQSGSRSGLLACRPISGLQREEPCTPGFAKHLLTCAASHRRPSDAGLQPKPHLTSGGELRAEPDRKGVVFRRCVVDEEGLAVRSGSVPTAPQRITANRVGNRTGYGDGGALGKIYSD